MFASPQNVLLHASTTVCQMHNAAHQFAHSNVNMQLCHQAQLRRSPLLKTTTSKPPLFKTLENRYFMNLFYIITKSLILGPQLTFCRLFSRLIDSKKTYIKIPFIPMWCPQKTNISKPRDITYKFSPLRSWNLKNVWDFFYLKTTELIDWLITQIVADWFAIHRLID